MSIVKSQDGMVMVVVLSCLLMIGVLGTAMIKTSNTDMNISDNFKRGVQAFYAAESGLEIARMAVWDNYVGLEMTDPAKPAGTSGSFSTYTAWLDQMGITNGSWFVLDLNQQVARQQKADSVRIKRRDLAGGVGTELTVRSYGSDDVQAQRVVTEVLRVGADQFSGFDFAVLARNINCIMCHARIDNAERYYNTDPAMANSFDRVKVASLESMLLRETSADSYIAGTLYTRGIVTNKTGDPIVDLSPGGGGLEAWDMDGSGKILDPLNNVSFVNTTGSPLPEYGNLYLDYPTDPADMTDGELPTEFPAAIPDANGNRLVDQSEFDEIANSSYGTLNGGIIYGVPTGGSYGGASLPGLGNEMSVNGTYDGNLILVGTDANPIQINSQVAVNGDVIIQGKVVGDGQVFAKGNVYVTGDVEYIDGDDGMGNRTFGIASDASNNALSLAAGGNIMVGDYLTPKKGDLLDPSVRDAGDGTTDFSFTMSEVTLFNRSEWSKTQPQLPGAGGGMVGNPEYDPTYKPRYYAMGPGDPVYIYNKNWVDGKGKDKGTYYDPATRSWKGKEHVSKYDLNVLTQMNLGDPQLSNATVVNLAPEASWVSESQLKNFWIDDENSRSLGDEFSFDGQLYTNNSIFSLTRRASNTGGRMHINGSIVASDLGILVPTELQVNYDSRMRTSLNVMDTKNLAVARVSWSSN